MTFNEVKETCENLKKQGYTDENIQQAFEVLFCNGTIDLHQLSELYTIINVKMTDAFLKLPTEEQKAVIRRTWTLKK